MNILRFGVEIFLGNEKICKDKNRIMLSLLKHCYSSYDQKYFSKLYEQVPNKRKSFTFSIYMGDCEFLREEIIIPNKKIYLNFSTNDIEDGIMFYNSIITNKGRKFSIENNTLKIEKINMLREKNIYTNEVILKTMSPIVIREHKGDNKTTWYHSLNHARGKEVFMENLKYQLTEEFTKERILDIKEVEVETLLNKEVKVKHYGIEILSNICMLRIIGKPYLLDYLYKSGIGGRRSSGFGMVNLV